MSAELDLAAAIAETKASIEAWPAEKAAIIDSLNTEEAAIGLGPPKRQAPPTAFAPMHVSALYDSTSETIEWLWDLILPKGALVLLAAFMKAGKTTLAYALVAALVRGLAFLDHRTEPTRVLILALEENKRDVKRRLQKFGVSREAALFVQFRAVPTTPSEWAALCAFVREQRIGLIVVDTLARCWPVWGVDSENDNAKVAAALSPLLELCREADVTALLLHHVGKLTSEGHGREVRGAGAILALADQALLFDRHRAGDPCDRVIRILGRYDESPGETVIRYDKAEGTYTVVRAETQDEDARGAERLFPDVLAYLRRKGATGASLRDVRSNIHGRGVTKDKALGALLGRGQVLLRDGRYYHPDHRQEVRVPACPSVSADTGETGVSAVSPPVRGDRTRDTPPQGAPPEAGHGTRDTAA